MVLFYNTKIFLSETSLKSHWNIRVPGQKSGLTKRSISFYPNNYKTIKACTHLRGLPLNHNHTWSRDCMRSHWTHKYKLGCSHQRRLCAGRTHVVSFAQHTVCQCDTILNRFFLNFDVLLKNAKEIGVVRKLSVQNL